MTTIFFQIQAADVMSEAWSHHKSGNRKTLIDLTFYGYSFPSTWWKFNPLNISLQKLIFSHA